MSLKDQAAAWVRTVAHQFLRANARGFQWLAWTAEVRVSSSLGGIIYLSPLEGKLVDQNELFVLVQTSASNFCVVLKELLSEIPAIGSKIRLQFYQPRRFDGSLADGSEDAGSSSFTLTGTKTKFPVKWEGRYLGINERQEATYTPIRNPHLQELIKQLEEMPVDGGYRRAVNILVDAGATDLQFVDPPEEDSAVVPPAIRFKVATAKLTGLVEINYDRAMDYYRVNVEKSYEPLNTIETVRHEDIDFEQLPLLLADLLDDGEWRKVKVSVLKPAPKAKARAPALQA